MPTQTLSTVNKKNPNIPQDNFATTAIAQSQQAQLNVKQQIEQLRNDLTEQERYEQHLKAIAQKGASAMQQVENTAADIIATGDEELVDYANAYEITKEDISRENNNEKKLTAKHYRNGIISLLGYQQKAVA